MAVRLLFFARCAEWVDRRDALVPLAGPARVRDLLSRRPEWAPILEHAAILKVAVNRELAGFDEEVHDGDEVAFLPPVSGG